MNWLQENWFKLALVLIIPFTSIVLVYGFVIYPENKREEEKSSNEQKEILRLATEKTAEEERVENLNQCLEESEYQESSSHLALCGDPNVGLSPRSCSAVFGGAKNVGDVIRAYNTEFPGKLPELTSLDDIENNYNQRLEIINPYWDECNCGLAKTRRDELSEEKKYRDEKCYALFGKN